MRKIVFEIEETRVRIVHDREPSYDFLIFDLQFEPIFFSLDLFLVLLSIRILLSQLTLVKKVSGFTTAGRRV